MAQLVFPVLPDGLLVDVMVGLHGAALAAQVAAGAVTPPVAARGEIDTGSNITAVSPAVLRALGVPLLYQRSTRTAAGLVTVDVFKVSVGVRNAATPAVPELIEPDLHVMELPAALPQIDVLIGLDFLLGCRFALDGPAGLFSLDQ
jgi:hypothetical protein